MADPDPDPVAGLVAAVLASPARLGRCRLVAIDGPSGSGKTWTAARLVDALRAAGVGTASVSTDHFATWDDPFDWWPRFEADVLDALAADRSAHYRAMDWTDGSPVARTPVTVAPAEVIVFEGVSAARRSVADRLSLAMWVDQPDLAVRTERAIARDGAQIREPLRRWQEAEAAWFRADDTRSRADRIVPAG